MMLDKKFLLVVCFGIFLISCSYGVLAATTLTSPVNYGNYSSEVATTFISITGIVGTPGITNITCYYNESGGATNTSAVLIELLNYTPIQASFNDSNYSGITNLTNLVETADITYPSTAIGYNISCNFYNGTSLNTTLSATNITIDNTNPQLDYGVVTQADSASVSYNWIYANISLTEIHNDTITFRLFYANGSAANATLFTGGAVSTKYINWTGLADGVYTYNITVNDSAGNSIITDTYTITLDNVAPVPTIASSSATQTSLTLTVTADGGTSGTTAACTVNRSGASISGTGATQTLTESSLSCGESYSYNVTCSDTAGNSGSSVATSSSFSTSSCSGGYASGGGSGGASYTWKNTYSLNGEQFKAGYTKELKVQNRIKVQVGSTYHHVGVKELTADSATIEIASDPVEVILNIGEDAKVDVNNDSIYDIYVKLLGIASNQANVFVQEISEQIPAEKADENIETTGEVVTGEEPEVISDVEKTDLTWLWVLIIVLVIVAVIGTGFAVKKRK